MSRQRVSSGAPWEATVGYSRAIRVGNHVFVAGTTGIGADGQVVADDAYAQAKRVLAIIGEALAEVGASMSDVVRTRMYVVDIARDGDAVGRAHGDVFHAIRPAATMVEVQRLIDPAMRVEIEVDAVVRQA
jgi:enamine deaminase RidA (YjgF/YER057c/UK114 family)